MALDKIIIGFLGAGGIARSHVYSLNSLRYYYSEVPEIELEAVCSATKRSRENFAIKYGFKRALSIEEFASDSRINTIFILGPNKVHFEHFKIALEMPSVKYIYLEKPVCSDLDEEQQMLKLAKSYPEKKVQVGFQYLMTAAMRKALLFWHSHRLGNPLHFDLKYFHGDYLQKSYREKRVNRLTPAPDGGAMADLGSHAISLLVAFLGSKMKITNALQAGHFEDVSPESDLFSLITLHDPSTNAVGTLAASRITSGSGDHVSLEMYAEKGALRYSSHTVDCFEYFLEETGQWIKEVVGSSYGSVSSFPSVHVPPGWLRAMVHAHYVFLTGNDPQAFIPDLEHGLAVQRLVRETAVHLENFRKNK